jgi:hypothetical protein
VLREDARFIAENGKRKTFHVGSNSSCRQHIRGHYDVYKEKCAELGIGENHHALPQALMQAQEDAKKNVQKKLDGMFQKAPNLRQFSREDVLRAVAEFVVCDDQASIQYHHHTINY